MIDDRLLVSVSVMPDEASVPRSSDPSCMGCNPRCIWLPYAGIAGLEAGSEAVATTVRAANQRVTAAQDHLSDAEPVLALRAAHIVP